MLSEAVKAMPSPMMSPWAPFQRQLRVTTFPSPVAPPDE
jgi:hypothetical protein